MRRVIVLCIAAIGFAAQGVSAQEGALSRLYGQGVHAYFGGNLAGAEKLFTQAIDGGSQDPRLHYFRGLIYLKAGRKQAADAEFEKGAELEVGAIRAYDVSLALERVQGRPRLALEEHRAAKLAAGTTATQTQRRDRLDGIRRREPETTVPATPNTLDGITGDAVPVPATRPEVAAPFDDPMEAESTVPATPKAGPAVPPVDEASEDPFGGSDALPADTETPPADTATEEETPFGAEEETPPAKAPADTTPPATTAPAADTAPPAEDTAPPADDEDPFGGDETAPAADESKAPTETPAPTDDAAPADDTAPAADDADPFGGDETPAPSDKAPAETPPAADDEDPFSS